jgi:hypothetical protein
MAATLVGGNTATTPAIDDKPTTKAFTERIMIPK